MNKKEWISIISQNQTLQNTECYDKRGISMHWRLMGTQSSSDLLRVEWKKLEATNFLIQYWLLQHVGQG